METVLPESVLTKAVEAAKFEQRERKRDAMKFLQAMLISAASPAGGRQADIMRTYFENGAPKVARGSFYDWFGPPLEAVMQELAGHALEFVQAQETDLPGILGCVTDWRIVDSTTVRLHDDLKSAYPGAGDYAALKLHKTLSVGRGTVIDYHLSPAREPSLERLRECQRFDVRIIIRLKENWKPKVQRIVRGSLSKTFVPGTDLDLLLEDDALILGHAIDADVTVGHDAIPMRLCGVVVPGRGYCFYLTNLPRSLGPYQVADLYRVRWEIELNNKLDKSSHRLNEIDSRKPAAVNALVHTTIISSILVALIVHRYNVAVARRSESVRTEAPLHHGLVARMLATCALRIAEALELRGPEADAQWGHLAQVIVHAGRDPNWRRKPSILDQLRGWKIMPSTRPKRASARSTA